MSKIQIKNRYTEAVLFECEVPDTVSSGFAIRHALEKAVASGAYLDGANLNGANLRGAYLDGANLNGATLNSANLEGAYFSEDKVLIGERPFFTIGPIGSRCAMLHLWLTDKGPYVKAGCFTGTIEEFSTAVEKTHSGTDHAKEYQMAILMMKSHTELWTPK